MLQAPGHTKDVSRMRSILLQVILDKENDVEKFFHKLFSAEAEPAHHKRVKRHFHIYVEEEHSPPVHYMGVN